MTEFVHLHLHTDYSLLDGASPISWSKLKEDERKNKTDIVSLAKEYKMGAVAMTDHGMMGGAVEFYKEMSNAGIKPIIGCEAYLSPTTRFDRRQEIPYIKGYHLVLLAQNNTGYRNLCKLISEAHLNGVYYKPRIDKEFLAAHSEGLIGLSACLAGEIPRMIADGRMKDAKKALQEYVDIFGKDNFFLEIMDHGMEEQIKVNKELVHLSNEFNIPLVATNDVHYLRKEHARSHDLLLCIQTHATYDEADRFRMSSDQFYFKSGDEMAQVFKELPQALKNTVDIAARCDMKFDFKANHYPVYDTSKEGITQKEKLRNICVEGIQERYDFDATVSEDKLTDFHKNVIKRMDYELGVIDNSKYSSYFLVVWDFINHARKIKVPVGPGRGSGAGSLVAYLTHITDIDPLRYNLLFERFLNPERVSPPDFDIDFCERRRAEVIEYVSGKYGADSVAQIGTYGTLKAKAVIKDVARALGRTPAEGDRVSKLIPADPKMTLAKALKESPDLKALLETEPWVKGVFDDAAPLEGINRNMSIHAAGVIIGDQRLDNVVPLARGAGNEVITQFPSVPCESLGLLKMDFLGLKTLTVIQDAVDNIKRHRGLDLDMSKIPLDDPATFKLLSRGDTVGVFQLESTGFQNLCRQFGVETIEHIIALVAIYRPGPMQFIPEFVARKMGTIKTEYDHPVMEPIIKETYGIMLYQEQIMEVVQKLAGFTLGQADMLRRAIGKKKMDEMMKQKEKFVKGCAVTNNIKEETANQIWDKIEMFAGYGFNKSHSAAYAFVTYRTAYLKANYPAEFMAAILTSEIDKAEKVAFFISECREMGIPILPPDINTSESTFAVDGKAIRCGLGAIKGVGEQAAGNILKVRTEGGVFKNLLDFCERAGSFVNSKTMEHLTRAGAFDGFGVKRSQIIAVIDDTMKLAQSRVKDKAVGQGSLFDMLGEAEQNDIFSIPLPDIPEFEEFEMLKEEKLLLGFYVSGHPLTKYSELIKTYSSSNLIKVSEMETDCGVKIGGIIKTCSKKVSKTSGKPYAILELEDWDGIIECMVYSKAYEESKDMLAEDVPIFLEAITSKREETEKLKLMAEKIMPLESVTEHYTKEIHVHLYESTTKQEDLQKLRDLVLANPGKTNLVICVTCSNDHIVFIESSAGCNVKVTKEFLETLQDILGERRYKLKADKSLPKPRPRYNNNNQNANAEQGAAAK